MLFQRYPRVGRLVSSALGSYHLSRQQGELWRRNIQYCPVRCYYATSKMSSGYTASDAFFQALWDSGVRACFVNLGSDHPSLIEAMIKGQKEKKEAFPRIYTCPNEMVAMSMADGWARVTGSPQAVIVHVDVGTQSIAAAMHNANTGRAPVLVFAGLCPYTEDGFLQGYRTEYQHWLQDAPNQKAIISDYCRYTGDVRTGHTVRQIVFRAMQLASSDPKGPVYLTGAREVMAENITNEPTSNEKNYGPIGPAALPRDAVETISHALLTAQSPLIITGYSGRNYACPGQLVQLADKLGLQVLDTGGSDMCFPANHPSYCGFRLSYDLVTTKSDTIFVLDCDVPWIPARNPPQKNCKIYHVDVDPLNATIGFSFFPANGRWKADAYTALTQLNQYLDTPASQETLQAAKYRHRRETLGRAHTTKLESLSRLAAPSAHNSLDIHQAGSLIKAAVPENTVFVVEAATCSMPLSDQLQVTEPGSWINCGGAGLGWSGGAALGVKLAHDKSGGPNSKFVCQVVGDGTFLFSVPSSVYWIASRYNIAVLTVVLNNKGWNAPRQSHKLVYPEGLGASATNEQMHISLDPPPDYSGIAKAAAGNTFGVSDKALFAGKAVTASGLKDLLNQAVKAVQEGRGAVLEVVLSVDEMGETLV